MINVKETFEERKGEIEFYYSVLVEIDKENSSIQTIDNARLFKIMKSNFILMLYNLVESTVSTGMLEIYESIKNDSCTYKNMVQELQTIWRDAKVKQVYSSSTELKTYTNRVKDIVDDITTSAPFILEKGMLNINGNLNAGRIKHICDDHRIRYTVVDDDNKLEEVRKKRNSLAHGDESFSQCARDLTLSDLESIKDIIIRFLQGIIHGMEDYCDNKKYLLANSNH